MDVELTVSDDERSRTLLVEGIVLSTDEVTRLFAALRNLAYDGLHHGDEELQVADSDARVVSPGQRYDDDLPIWEDSDDD